jgi:hypothetical protein
MASTERGSNMPSADAAKNGRPKTKFIIHPNGAKLIIAAQALDHMLAHQDVTDDLLREAFSKIDLSGGRKEIRECVDLGRIIGVTSKIETPLISPDEIALFALRTGRKFPSRTITDVDLPESAQLAVIAEWSDRGAYFLRTAFIGQLAPPEPWSFNTIRKMRLSGTEVLRFWCMNALAYDNSFISEPFESTWNEILRVVEVERNAERNVRN